jgi:rhodanese-related sulfurtransferase
VVYQTISPEELKARMTSGEPPLLLDVREPVEFEIAAIEGARLLPLSQFDQWTNSLDREQETVVICHHGIRSAHVCALLSRAGFDKVYNLEGGIDAWSRSVDDSVPRY